MESFERKLVVPGSSLAFNGGKEECLQGMSVSAKQKKWPRNVVHGL